MKPSSREARERSVDSMFPPRETCLYGSPAPRPRRQPGFLLQQNWRPVALRTALTDGLPVRLGPDASLIARAAQKLEWLQRLLDAFLHARTATLDGGMARQLAIWAAVLFAIGADRGRDRAAASRPRRRRSSPPRRRREQPAGRRRGHAALDPARGGGPGRHRAPARGGEHRPGRRGRRAGGSGPGRAGHHRHRGVRRRLAGRWPVRLVPSGARIGTVEVQQ